MKEEFFGYETRVFHDNKRRMFDTVIPQSDYLKAEAYQGLENSDGVVRMIESKEYPIPQDYKEGRTEIDDITVQYEITPQFLEKHTN